MYDIENLHDPKIRDIILFGLKCSRDPQHLTDVDFNQVRRHGLDHPEIIEITAMFAQIKPAKT